MTIFPPWEPAVRCTDRATPGAIAFMAWFMEEYGPLGGFNLGIYNCRSVRGGSTTSLHGEGRACDCGFPVSDPDGDDFLNRLLKVPGRLGIQAIIYERVIYSRLSPGGRPYTGVVPHTTHLHIEFTREASHRLNLATIRAVMLTTAPKPTPPGSRSLREGDSGQDVRWVQRKLGVKVDGEFGPITKRAVLRFEQKASDEYPKMLADGIVGPITWHALGVVPKYKKRKKAA